MTPRQSRFIKEYLVDLNGTQAAIRAGYSENGASVQATTLLANPKIAERIAKGKRRYARETKLTAVKVLRELKALAFSCIDHYVVDGSGNVRLADGAPANAMAAISSIDRKVSTHDGGRTTVEVKVKLWDKTRSLKLAGRHIGLFPDRVELSGANGGPMQIAPMTAEEAAREIAALEAKARGRSEPWSEP